MAGINSFIESLVVSYLLLIIVLLLKAVKRVPTTWYLLFLTLGGMGLVLGHSRITELSPIALFFVFLMFSASFSFFLLTRRLFVDRFRPSILDLLLFLGYSALCMTGHFIRFHGWLSQEVWLSGFGLDFVKILPQILVLFLGFFSLWIAWRDKNTDLVEERNRFRGLFIPVTAVCLTVLTVGAATLDFDTPSTGRLLLTNLLILPPLLIFMYYTIEFKTDLFRFSFENKKEPVEVATSPLLLEKIEKAMAEDRLYRKEGVSIKMLSEIIAEPEYKIRIAINSHWNFKNFNDYINRFRVEDAKKILADPRQNKLTILEIAYQLGYNSISPFNRAFKEITGTTPTTYRKSNASSEA